MEIKLPEGYEASKLKWFSVWCRRFSVNFGDVMFDTTTEKKVGALETKSHGVKV